MNIFKYILTTVCAVLFYCASLYAQFSIEPRKGDIKIEPLELIHDLPPVKLEAGYFDKAAWNAERLRLRKERNTFEFNAGLETSLQQFENWTGSGTNNFYALANIFLRHQYRKAKFSSDYKVEANYGLNYIDEKLFKNKDEFKINAQVGWTAKKYWSYSASANFRSQFSVGYASRTDSTIVSKFMSPGYFDISGGFTYSKPKIPRITISPIGGNLVTVLDPDINSVDKYGVAANERMLFKLGPSVEVFSDYTVGKKKSYRFRTSFYTFASYKDILNPIVRLENTMDITITKLISMRMYGQLYYFKEASSKLQYQYSFLIGLRYTFKNK